MKLGALGSNDKSEQGREPAEPLDLGDPVALDSFFLELRKLASEVQKVEQFVAIVLNLKKERWQDMMQAIKRKPGVYYVEIINASADDAGAMVEILVKYTGGGVDMFDAASDFGMISHTHYRTIEDFENRSRPRLGQ